ncbi:MAG: nitrous oxide reductase accessory protein NosL [Thermomicrobium sp.]|nr:nitrous oxide reductase accessory protein NosL [Thermomicrobium sp.]MDW8060412.1 nitrous oxide reductase accessory protein NosL [Thermomicrobium sp.]
MTRRRMLAMLFAALPLLACRRERTLAPPEIRYGRDTCAECGMIVSEARHAAAAASAKGETLVFDDIGCLLRYRQKHAPQWAAVWVHDYETEIWLRAEEAQYLVSPKVRSPMGWGIAAFARADAAQQRRAELGGDVMNWSELLARPLERPR